MLNQSQINVIEGMFKFIVDKITTLGGNQNHIRDCFDPIHFKVELLKELDSTMIDAMIRLTENGSSEQTLWYGLRAAFQAANGQDICAQIQPELMKLLKALRPSINPFNLLNLRLFIRELNNDPAGISQDLKIWLIILRQTYLEISETGALDNHTIDESLVWKQRKNPYPFNIQEVNRDFSTGEISIAMLTSYTAYLSSQEAHADWKKESEEEKKRLLAQFQEEKIKIAELHDASVFELKAEFKLEQEEKLQEILLQKFHANLEAFQLTGRIPYVPTYSALMMEQLLRYYMSDESRVELITAMTGTDWRELDGIEQSLEKNLGFVHHKRHRHAQEQYPACVIIPINLGERSLVNAFSLEKKPQVVTVKLPGNQESSLEVVEETIPGYGDCGFIAMRITREDLVTTLLKAYADNPDGIAQRFCAEIREAYQRDFKDEKLIRLEDNYAQKIRTLDDVIRLTKDEYSNDHTIHTMDRETTLTWLKENAAVQFAQGIRIANEAQELEKSIFTYCRSEPVVKSYIEGYRKSLWLSIESALIYAEQKNITLYIWRSGDAKQTPMAYYEANNPTRSVYLYFKPGASSHFNRFEIATKPEPIQVPDERLSQQHEQWVLIGVRYSQKNVSEAIEVIYYDPRSIAVLESVRNVLEKIYPAVDIQDIGAQFPYSVYSGARVIEIAQLWSKGQLILPYQLSDDLTLARHKRVLWRLGAFQQLLNHEVEPTTQEEMRWFEAFRQAILRDDKDFLEIFLDPIPNREKQRLVYLSEQNEYAMAQEQLSVLANWVRVTQQKLINAYLLGSETKRDVQSLVESMQELANSMDSSISPFELHDDHDVHIVAREFADDENLSLSCDKKRKISYEHRQGEMAYLNQRHASLRRDHLPKMKNYDNQGNFSFLPANLQQVPKGKLSEELLPDENRSFAPFLPTVERMHDEGGFTLLDIAMSEQKPNCRQWLQELGATSQLYRQAVKSITKKDLNFLTLVLDIRSIYEHATQLVLRQQILFQEIRESLTAQMQFVHKQCDLLMNCLNQYAAEIPTVALVALQTALDNALENMKYTRQQQIKAAKPVGDDLDVFNQARDHKSKYIQRLLDANKVRVTDIASRQSLVTLKELKQAECQNLVDQQKALVATQLPANVMELINQQLALDNGTKLEVLQQLLEEGQVKENQQREEKRPSIASLLNFYSCLSIDAIDEKGNTLLHHAFKSGNGDLILFLLSYRPKIKQNAHSEWPYEIKDAEGLTLLHRWIAQGEWQITYTLVKYLVLEQPALLKLNQFDGANRRILDATDPAGDTLLHQILKALVNHSDFGSFSLPLPASDESRKQYMDVATILIDQNADVLMANGAGKTAFDIILKIPSEEEQTLLVHLILKRILERGPIHKEALRGSWSPLQIKTLECLFHYAKNIEEKREEEKAPRKRTILDKLKRASETNLNEQKNTVLGLVQVVFKAHRQGNDESLIQRLMKDLPIRGIVPGVVIFKSNLKKLAKMGNIKQEFAILPGPTRQLVKLKTDNSVLKQEVEGLQKVVGQQDGIINQQKQQLDENERERYLKNKEIQSKGRELEQQHQEQGRQGGQSDVIYLELIKLKALCQQQREKLDEYQKEIARLNRVMDGFMNQNQVGVSTHVDNLYIPVIMNQQQAVGSNGVNSHGFWQQPQSQPVFSAPPPELLHNAGGNIQDGVPLMEQDDILSNTEPTMGDEKSISPSLTNSNNRET